MANRNKHGLSRDIDASIEMLVRKRDGFGCVICGLGVYTYEHFNPPFCDAHEHNADGIALLCGQHQLQTTKGLLSKETIQNHANNPYCQREGYSNAFFDMASPLMIHFGNFEYYSCKGRDHTIVVVNDEVVLRCSEDPSGGPMQLSAIFRDSSNDVSLEIVNNEWRASTENWDIKQIGKQLLIYESNRKIGIEIEANPPRELHITRFTTYYNGTMLKCDKKAITMTGAHGQKRVIPTPDVIRRSAPITFNLT